MAKYQYHISGSSSWFASSGNAALALINYAGSGKKINVHSFEVYNNTRFGAVTVAGTLAPVPTRLQVGLVTGLNGGTDLLPQKHDSAAGAWPSTVKVSTGAGFTPILAQRGSSLTMAGATAGSTTFTPGVTPAPAWTTNEHRQTSRYFVVPSGSNIGTYRVSANTATQLTLTHPFVTTASTTGYLAEASRLSFVPILKQLQTSTSASGFANTNFGFVNGRNFAIGNVYRSSTNSATQKATVRANEQMAVFADFPNSNVPMFVSVTMVRNGAPDYTYTVSYYAYMCSEYNSLFSIDNQSGSGETIQVVSISVSEVGTHDTPYFQLVPISKVDPDSLDDPERKVTSSVVLADSLAPALTSICDVFYNVPVSATGIPVSYIAEGSVNATPKGFNYLNTKDFIGPTYMALFPESATFKSADATFWSNPLPGTLGSNISQKASSIKGGLAPIVIREGEGIAMVSGAETAAGATVNTVGISGWSGIDFAMTFSVENATTPALELTGLQPGSETLILNHATGAALAAEESNVSGTFSYSYDYSPGVAVDVIVHSIGYEYYRIDNVALTTNGLSIPVAQRFDRNYSNP